MTRAPRGDELRQPSVTHGSPYHTNSALHPVIGLLEQITRLDRNEAPQAQLIKLEAVLGRANHRLDEVVPLLAALLSIPIGERYPALILTPEVQKRRTLQALVDQLVGLAAKQPVLAVHEDVHWIDPSTLELLGIMVERVRQLPVLVLITFRPEFQPPWTRQAHVTALTLGRLGRRQGSELVSRVTGDKPLPAEIIEQILARTDGVPLYVEELTRTVMERAPAAITADALPETLRDLLMERLDRLPLGRTVVQTASVIGRSFGFEDLQGLLHTASEDLVRTLDFAVSAGVLLQRGFPPQATYAFKHFLIRDAAYETLLIRRRRELHRTLAETLEQRPEKSCPPELIAQHFAAAGMPDRAFPLFFGLVARRTRTARSRRVSPISTRPRPSSTSCALLDREIRPNCNFRSRAERCCLP